MASFGGLVALEELDMQGCRGDAAALEARLWQAIAVEQRRRAAAKAAAEATADGKADALPEERRARWY